MKVAVITLIIFIFNIPFGYWRANVKKLSVQWFLSIHIPIPFIILIRIYSNIGFALYTYPLFVGAFFGGQYLGKTVYNHFKVHKDYDVTSCLVMDWYRLMK
jgi:hypothetical protein